VSFWDWALIVILAAAIALALVWAARALYGFWETWSK
jgi:hypothetical protein